MCETYWNIFIISRFLLLVDNDGGVTCCEGSKSALQNSESNTWKLRRYEGRATLYKHITENLKYKHHEHERRPTIRD